MRSVFGAVLLLLLSAGAAVAGPAATVVGVSGGCVVESGGSKTALALGAAVQVGDTVEVGVDGRLKLRMADGSIVSFAAGTRMTVTAYSVNGAGQRQEGQLSLARGLLHSIVTPSEPPAKFEVDTAVGSAAVRSTDWLIEATATSERVAVQSGNVVVTSAATRRSVVVPAQRTTQVQRGRDPLPPRRLSRAGFAHLLGRTELRPHRAAPRRQPEHYRSGRPPERHGARRATAPRGAAWELRPTGRRDARGYPFRGGAGPLERRRDGAPPR
jgi:hypothetical protein